jgi:hypothetical protein
MGMEQVARCDFFTMGYSGRVAVYSERRGGFVRICLRVGCNGSSEQDNDK